eukprot:GILJ01001215.1.p2 GENE.GILJ01001215.1~~GILJ01001215.1.p2  ORF type:complete len:215 (-),score=27.26 GILJ01001215.1:286-879(-)
MMQQLSARFGLVSGRMGYAASMSRLSSTAVANKSEKVHTPVNITTPSIIPETKIIPMESPPKSGETAAEGGIGLAHGIPVEHLRRRVRIFKPSRNAMQQGISGYNRWKVDFDPYPKWKNPLMGWTATEDPLTFSQIDNLYFDTMEAAVDFVNRHGWEYQISLPHEKRKFKKSYSDNYKWKGPADTTDQPPSTPVNPK